MYHHEQNVAMNMSIKGAFDEILDGKHKHVIRN